eukprot:s2541_g8.t1
MPKRPCDGDPSSSAHEAAVRTLSRVTSAAEACRAQRRNKEQDCNYNAVRSTFYRQTAAWLERACASYSLKLKDGSEYEWKLPHLEILLQEAADTSPCLQSLLLRLPDGHPAQEALFFCDACTPGNVLAPDRQRKTVGFYLSFFAFGKCLGNHAAWFCIGCLRHSIVQQLPGGISEACAIVLRQLQELHDKGHALQLGSEVRFLRPLVRAMVLDEEAMAGMWGLKGSSGRRPCIKCLQIVSKKVCSDIGPGCQWFDISHPDISDITQTTDEQIWAAYDHLEASRASMSKAAFKELEMNLGMKMVPNSILSDRQLRSYVRPSDTTYDLLHCLYHTGIVSQEMYEFTERLEAAGMDRTAWKQSVQLAYKGYYNARLRTTKTDGLLVALGPAYFGDRCWKARGSTARDAMHAVHIWCLTEAGNTPAAGLKDEMKSLLLLLRRLYIIKLVQTCPQGDWLPRLLATQKEHQEFYGRTYSTESCRPKHHYSLHHPLQFAKYSMIPDTLPCEAKHKLLKDVVETFGKRLRGLENYTTARMHRFHLQECQELDKDYWQYRLEMHSGLKSAESPWLSLKVGDPVIWPTESVAGIVQDLEVRKCDLLAKIRLCSLLKSWDLGICVWSVVEDVQVVTLTDESWVRPHAWLAKGSTVQTLW